MKKSINLTLIFSFLVSFLFAQNTDYYDRMELVFGAIDPSKVNTGLLKEFGIRLTDVEAYDGDISNFNWADKLQWYSLYGSMYTMRVDTSIVMATPPTVYNHFKTQEEANPDVVLLAVEYYEYEQYKEDAYTNGDVVVFMNRIIDVAGKNPYDIKSIFAVAPLKDYLFGNTFNFRLQSNMVYTNTGKTVSSVLADFNDGQGFQTITLDNNKLVAYSSGGDKELTVKITYSDGTILESHSKIYIDYVSPTAQFRFNGTNLFADTTITGDPYNGSAASGHITVETSSIAPDNGAFNKPLIVVEGFDPRHENEYENFIDGSTNGAINIDIDPSPAILTLNQAIDDEHYDLVFVNLNQPTKHIQSNAYLLEEVIDWVNARKTSTAHQNVVIGISMGGLVARYALRHMEIENEDHDTNLYISHDSPHQGANIPLSLQAMVRHWGGEFLQIPIFDGLIKPKIIPLTFLIPDLGEGLDIVRSPAARQMMIYQLQDDGEDVSIDNTTIHHSFMDEYHSMGLPQQTRNIAIANGSECGTPLDFAPNASIVHMDSTDNWGYLGSLVTSLAYSITLNPIRSATSFYAFGGVDLRIRAHLKALPDQEVKNIYASRMYLKKKKVIGFITVREDLINEKKLNSSSSMLALDNAPGGIFPISEFADVAAFKQYILEPEFSFIPTYSSLDIGEAVYNIVPSDLTRVYSPLIPPTGVKTVPFDNFVTDSLASSNHVQFTPDNGNWLMEELRGNQAFYSCAGACANPPEMSISGPSHVCTTNATFSVNWPPSNAIFNWTVSSNLNIVSINHDEITVTSNSNSSGETAWLSVSIDTGCGIITGLKSTWTGAPDQAHNYDLFVQGNRGVNPVSLAGGSLYQFQIDNVLGATNYNWLLPPGFSFMSGQQSNNTSVNGIWTTTQNGTYTLRVYPTNSCGSEGSGNKTLTITIGGGCSPCPPPAFAEGGTSPVYPNPADDLLTIDLRSLLESTENSNLKTKVKIYDENNVLVYNKTHTGDSYTINVQGFQEGLYYLNINSKDISIQEQIIIEHN